MLYSLVSSAIACACPFFALYVCWIAGCCLRPRFDVLPLRTRLESTHDDLFSSKGYWFRKWNGRKKIDKKKNKGKKTSNKHEQWPLLKDQSWNWRCFIVFDLPPPPQAIEAVPLSWAFCENCLSVLCEFFSQHDDCAESVGTPCAFYRGVVVVAAFFGYFFGL